jgi:hypothetical protein
VKSPVSPWRWVRAWVLGGSAVGLSAGGHVIGGGHAEPVLIILLMVVAVLAAYGWLRSERSLLAILAAVAVVQVGAHVVLSAGHAQAGSTAMTVAHFGAGIVLAVLLRNGESRIFAAARRRFLQWLITVRTALAGLPARRPVGAGIAVLAGGALATGIHSDAQGRAPPVAAFC